MIVAKRETKWWQRALLVFGQLAVLPVGFLLASLATAYLEAVGAPPPLLIWIFFGGAGLTVGALLFVFWKTRRWKFAYDVEHWWAEREERRLRPRGWRWKRAARRILIWVPSGIAAFVVFFFPVATHVVFPGAGNMKHYRVPLPLQWTIEPRWLTRNLEVVVSRKKVGQFGFWNGVEVYEDGTAVFVERASDRVFAILEEKSTSGEKLVEHVSRREFVLGKSTLMCWEFRWAFWPAGTHWEVRCTTPPEEGERGFSAFFYGRREDIPGFYEVVEKVKTVE